jgi:maleate isomerase
MPRWQCRQAVPWPDAHKGSGGSIEKPTEGLGQDSNRGCAKVAAPVQEHWAGPGWRARIGLIYPACGKRDNDFSRLVPPGVSVHVTRVAFSGRVTAEDIGAMAELGNLRAAARLLKDVQPSCVSWVDTSGSFMFGPECDIQQAETIHAEAGVPASTTTTAVLAACARLGVSNLAIASPYVSEVNDQLRSFLGARGLAVSSMRSLDLESEWEIHSVGREAAYRLARDAYTPWAEALFIPCTDFEAIDLIEILELDLGVPVITANQATMWHALRLSGVLDPIPRFGKLYTLQDLVGDQVALTR